MDRDQGSCRSPLAALPRARVPSGGEAMELELGTVLETTALTAKPSQCLEKPPPRPQISIWIWLIMALKRAFKLYSGIWALITISRSLMQ